jgi:hypothetical protein
MIRVSIKPGAIHDGARRCWWRAAKEELDQSQSEIDMVICARFAGLALVLV